MADTPFVQPLVPLAERERLGVLVVSRRNGRILTGTGDTLEEVAQVADDVKNQHSQGGWARRISVDVDLAKPDEVRAKVERALEEVDREREREVLERLEAGLNSPAGAAAAGLDDVLGALNEQRVETLLYVDGFSAPGVVDPASAWLGVGEERSPITGEPAERRENVLDEALHAALRQAASAVRVRFDREALARREGIAAILRF